MSLHPQFSGMNPFLSLQQSHSNSTSTSTSPNGNINGSNLSGNLPPNVSGPLNDPGSAVQVEIGNSSSSSNSPLDGLNCKSLGTVDHHLGSRLLLSSTRHQDREASALMLMGLGLKSKLLCEGKGPQTTSELLQIKAELPFDDEDELEDEIPTDEEEEDEDEKLRGSIKINIEKNLEPQTTTTIALSSTNSVPVPETPQSIETRRPSQQEIEQEREVNTPSPKFQTS